MPPSRGSKVLKSWRGDAGYTQQQLAELVGVRQTNVWAWEVGKKSPALSHALTLERVSDGAVLIDVWGFSKSVINEICAAGARRRRKTG